MRLRLAEPEDCESVIALIDRVLHEYGDAICLDDADRDLVDIEHHYHRQGGAFIVLDDDGEIRGTHATLPAKGLPDVCIFRRLYLDQGLRGSKWGGSLMDWAVDWACSNGFGRVEFWSDTRFNRAHSFFRRCGFRTDGRTREMDDGIAPYLEYFFYLNL